MTFEMPFTPVILAALIALAAILAYLLYCVGLRARQDKPDSEWLQNFTVERYRPMLRMLAETDHLYLKSRGVDPIALKRLRVQRREAFALYLKNLVRDFNRLH